MESLIADFLKTVSLPKEELENLNSRIGNGDILAVVKSLPNNKSPGANGFTAEYYKAFPDTPHLKKLFKDAASTASFPSEMLRATIVTLPKPGKTPDCPQNFLPILLLNSDLEI